MLLLASAFDACAGEACFHSLFNGNDPDTMEICGGTSHRVVHDGVVVVDDNAREFPERARRTQQGSLGLQDHREEVWYRNLRIGPPQSGQQAHGQPMQGKA
jgi:hypothetical protein